MNQQQTVKAYVCPQCGEISEYLPCEHCIEVGLGVQEPAMASPDRPIYRVFDTARALIHAKGSDDARTSE